MGHEVTGENPPFSSPVAVLDQTFIKINCLIGNCGPAKLLFNPFPPSLAELLTLVRIV